MSFSVFKCLNFWSFQRWALNREFKLFDSKTQRHNMQRAKIEHMCDCCPTTQKKKTQFISCIFPLTNSNEVIPKMVWNLLRWNNIYFVYSSVVIFLHLLPLCPSQKKARQWFIRTLFFFSSDFMARRSEFWRLFSTKHKYDNKIGISLCFRNTNTILRIGIEHWTHY